MGYPIYSNIFSDNPDDSRELRRFPIQIAVLFSPGDRPFCTAFRELFVELDKLTGEEVVFFALLDPPDEWLQLARNRTNWKSYWSQKSFGHDLNDRMLVEEISRQFGLKWEDLPALVISTNLWSAEFITARTSPDHIVSQLKTLTELAKQKRQTDNLDMGYILESLQDKFGFSVKYQPPDESLRSGLLRFYEILDFTFDQGRNILNPLPQFWNDVFFSSRRAIQSLVTKLSEPNQDKSPLDFRGIDSQLRTLAAQLTPFVARNEKIRGNSKTQLFHDGLSFQVEGFISGMQERKDILEALDDESLTMIDRSLRIASFLDNPEAIEPVLRGGNNRVRLEEYSPAGQGLWKAFEREINKSVVQAFRSARTIEMPQYFYRFRPNFTGRKTIQTPRNVDINRQDWEENMSDRHRLIEIGVALKCVDVMQGNPDEQFDQTIRRCLGNAPFPQQFIEDWKTIIKYRNPSSHSELLSRDGFIKVANSVLKPENLDVLLRIKRTLAN